MSVVIYRKPHKVFSLNEGSVLEYQCRLPKEELFLSNYVLDSHGISMGSLLTKAVSKEITKYYVVLKTR